MPARNLAPRTRREYSHDLTDLITFLEYSGVDRVGEIGLAHLDRYLAILDERGLSGSTRKRKAISIRTFLGFLYRERFISNDISRQVIVPFEESSTPRVLSQSECDRLREACGSNLRDRAIIELLLQTGLVRVTAGLRRKSRTLPLNTKASQALTAYLQGRPSPGRDNLFLNRMNKPLGPRGVQKMLTKYLERAGIKGARIHSLRHTFATQHIKKGTSLETIQEVLGHQDIRTT
ncbi:hypothetical protein A2701_01050 [Candidatus Amesbacteria bacterium RIFCSPHIGHO2_01_FULL_47_34]|uniref:Uncharacterized protein n=2 Tax=Microgenomates group TaxID=1794810 RepID=A0A0H4TK23_9BACT|nr:putative protein, integrase/recombinase XerC [uncultured Microgenomates bacterium Rifle_16ft_4_minimus_1180]OGD00127.1 MAG: hypothetical protein A2701_01050 [Candidatus Amesbacteria bacterium RIFCSPHIGHO2_01_FULL_47_34]OGD01526.1 MAG: hypothetical protein A2972_00445 [Candidatus Amesbacteria bacterium RIFCSPLOWO2_01_FULL_47_33]